MGCCSSRSDKNEPLLGVSSENGVSTQQTAFQTYKETDNKWTKTLQKDAERDKKIMKLLLLGPGNSGKSTFFKQLLRIHGDGFRNPKQFSANDMKRAIYDSIVIQMKAIIHQCQDFDYKLPEDVYNSSEYILNLPQDIEITNEISNHIKILWNNEFIKKSFEDRSNLGIVDSCPHFFNNIDRISSVDYQPSDNDILLVRTPTTGVISCNFIINSHNFSLFDVGGQRSERNKWIHCFDTVTAVIFVASLSCYDQSLFELNYVNGMHETLNLWDEICNSRWFRSTSMILFLNKSDLFQLKIEKKKNLNVCFKEYNGDNSFKSGVEFIRQQFLKLNTSKDERQIYSHITCATDRDNVEKVFSDVQHIVINASLQRGGLL